MTGKVEAHLSYSCLFNPSRRLQLLDSQVAGQWVSANGRYPKATKIWLVMDNLNMHGIGSMYKTFPVGEALKIAKSGRSITHTKTGAG